MEDGSSRLSFRPIQFRPSQPTIEAVRQYLDSDKCVFQSLHSDFHTWIMAPDAGPCKRGYAVTRGDRILRPKAPSVAHQAPSKVISNHRCTRIRQKSLIICVHPCASVVRFFCFIQATPWPRVPGIIAKLQMQSPCVVTLVGAALLTGRCLFRGWRGSTRSDDRRDPNRRGRNRSHQFWHRR